MKPSHRSTLCSLALALLLFVAQPLFAATQATFYVSPSGNDSNAGTLSAPFLTIAHAQTAVRSISGSMSGDIIVYLRGGVYPQSAPLTFGTQDSGTNGYHVIYEAYNNEVPVISGGVPVTGWTQVSGNIYSAPLSRTTKLRSLFVNGVRANMTKSGAVQGYGNEAAFTIPSNASYSIGGATGSEPDDVQFSEPAVGFYANPSDIELLQNYTFNSTIVSVRNIANYGGNPDFQLQEPYGALAGSMLYTTGLNPSGAFYIMNAYELLNSPGQFYFNRTTQTLYYYSRGENMATAQVIAPTTEGLIQIHGTSNTNRVANIEFIGITFGYDHWQMYNVAGSYGMAATQSIAGQVAYAGANNWHGVTYNDTENPQASIDLQNASGIVFQGDSFVHLSSGSAIGLTDDVINSTVLGNSFVDLSGNAISVGNAQNAYPNTSRLYPPSLWGVCTNDILQDNLIRNPNQLYYQFEGIAAVYVNGLQILHNDIGATGYDNLTLGWGWNVTTSSTSAGNNTVSYNRATQSNQIINEDGGSMYFLGQQPNTTISYNYIFNGMSALYEDAGSAYLTIKDNVISNEYWLYVSDPSDHDLTIENNYDNTNQDIIYSTQNITLSNNTYETTFDSTAQGIINASGLEPSYQYLLSAPVPNSLTATTSSSGTQLSWQNTGVATSFNVYRGTTPGGEGSTPYQAGVTGSTFTDASATTGTAYYYKVTAVGLAGESAASNEVSSSSAPNFVLSASPASLSVATGGTVTSQITTTPVNGLNATIYVTLGGLPTGVTGSLSGTTLTLTASSSAQLGQYSFLITATTGTITNTISVPLTVEPAFNVSAIATAGTAAANGGFDGNGNAYSSSLLGSSVLWNGVTFPIGPANSPDAVDNLKVTVAPQNYTSFSLLGAATGANTAGTIVATYTDGTTTSFSQTFSNWVLATPTVTQTNESVALAMSSYINGTTLTSVTGSTYNLYGYSFPLNSAKTLASITLPSSTAIKILSIVPITATPVSLSSAYNVYGIFTDGTNVTNGGFDGQGYAYSSNLLGTSVVWNGTTFAMGPANALDAVGNATITLPSGKYSALNLLGSGTNGAQSGTVLVTYTDGSNSSFSQGFSDWDLPSPPATKTGESLAKGMAYRDVGTGTNSYSGQTVNVYGYGFPLNSAKTVASLTLPANTNIKALAVSLLTTSTGLLNQTITFNAVPAQVVGGTLTPTATASSGLPITFTVVQNGNCSVSGNVVTFLNAGACGIIANQAGNATYAAAPAVGQVVQVNPAASQQSQTITFGALPNNEGVGNTLTVSATASSGLPVSFTVVQNGNCSISGNVVTFLNVGNCGVIATQAGNSTYAAAPAVGQIAVVTH
jgi:hypothetical protein